ncbi:RND family efflux transporter, MFP subunit [Mesorhizobium albiziae]|uniref:RND family efflux transporter, MFP subunit n=1 Tax=Neomesorhizobium albiziae TaxID=335020 RepID=A0A1I4CVS3_9HYPH|nr:efflux RND transporter periplasmic adaptor subunit [Mesorhizobium albiziae]GLS31002.1 MexE family multidrug efflux RND transporter periplasmic adaptor subunit [Mesorhizobium albiziae]SFK84106.1 RND family efflux transporter, MFP subunit [Mesorhizobium albiziae]
MDQLDGRRIVLVTQTIRRLITLAFIVMSGAVISACGQEAAGGTPPPAPDVGVAQVLSKPVREWDEFTGRIAAVEAVELRARVSGYMERVAYVEGQEIKKGDLLFVIDQRRYKSQLDAALAELERAHSAAELAQVQDVRARTLLASNAVSRDQADTRKATVAQSNAVVNAAEAAVADARLNLEFTEVRSPISGRAGRALVTAGNLVQADSTLLTTLVSQDPVYVYFDSDERSFLRYNALARLGERNASRNAVRVGLADEEGYPHQGSVDFTDTQVDPNTGTIRTRAILGNADRRFSPGMFARVQLEGARETRALLIDDKAVMTDQDRKYVYLVDAENRAQRRDVELGRMADGLRVVTAGLAHRDRVIVDGIQKVFMPGMPVNPQPIEMGAPPEPKPEPVASAN